MIHNSSKRVLSAPHRIQSPQSRFIQPLQDICLKNTLILFQKITKKSYNFTYDLLSLEVAAYSLIVVFAIQGRG